MSIIPPVSEFNLKEGMSDDDLWKELYRVGISGETRYEIISFKEPQKYHVPMDNVPLHNVLMSDKNYAVIRKSYLYVDIFGSVNESWTYYWCGINDEGKYFIRPIREFPWTEKPTIAQIADWVDRKDEGFDKRVQGDVLIKFIHKSYFPEFGLKPIKQRTIRTTFFPPLTPQINPQVSPNRYQQFPFSTSVRPIAEIFEKPKAKREENTHIEINLIADDGNKIQFNQITNSPLKLGNHKLFVDGKVFASIQMPYVCVDADSLILQHHEHKTVEERIPPDYVAILAAQRGRDFELGNLKYLYKSYD